MLAYFARPFPFTTCIALCLMFGVNQTCGGEPLVRANQFGDPLPKDALVRVGAMRCRVEGYAQSVAFSPDGKWLAAGDSGGLVFIWEVATGKMIRQFDIRQRSPAVFFSHDGKSLGTRTTQGEVRLWETDSGRRQASFQRPRRGNEYYHERLLLLPDRTRLIVVSDANSMIAVHNGKHADAYVIGKKLPELSIDLLESDGKLVKQLARNEPETVFSDAALSPDGKLLAVGIRAFKAPRKLLRLIDATTGTLVREIKGDGEGWFLSVAFSHDGKTLALGSKDEIALVDVAAGVARSSEGQDDDCRLPRLQPRRERWSRTVTTTKSVCGTWRKRRSFNNSMPRPTVNRCFLCPRVFANPLMLNISASQS